MTDYTADDFLDLELLKTLRAIGSSIFAHYGVDFDTVQRAGGWTNMVWLSDAYALRLATGRENTRLQYESRLAARFVPDVGYPQIVDTGMTDGFAWTLSKRLPGQCLGGVWSMLEEAQRATALCDLWQRAEAVHQTDAGGITVRDCAWFNTVDADASYAGLQRVMDKGVFTLTEHSVLRDALLRFWNALPSKPRVVCHGDMTMDNTMWHDGHVTALLDFEHAVLAPVQLDLNHLVKAAFGPDTIKEESLPSQRAVMEIAAPLLAHPEDKALLMGYAILLSLWRLEDWLAYPEGEGPLETWEPLRRLKSLADGKGGYLVPLL